MGMTRAGRRRTATRRARVAFFGALAVALLASASACSGEGTDVSSRPEDGPGPERSTESSPFTVSHIPDGFESVLAGRGTVEPAWGSDTYGNDDPYTLLSADGTFDGDDPVMVALTGYEGYQGGLGQAATGGEVFTIDGRQAIYGPHLRQESGREWWASLVVEWGDDLAVKVSAPHASRDELVEVLERIEVPDDRSPPLIIDPPRGLRVVGSVEAEATIANRSYFYEGHDSVPGPATAHSAGWISGSGTAAERFAVMSLPGTTADLLAVGLGEMNWMDVHDRREVSVGGGQGVVLDILDTESGNQTISHVLWTVGDWGDLIVVSALGAPSLDVEDLVAIAESVERTDAATWDAFVEQAYGGPGVRPDRGRAELAKGTIGDLEWLLQSGPVDIEEPDPLNVEAIDECLKLSNHRRACATGSSGGAHHSAEGGHGLPPFMIITSTEPAASARVTTPTDQATIPLTPAPGGHLWVGVAFVDDPGMKVCADVPPPDGLVINKVELFDANGTALECVGMI